MCAIMYNEGKEEPGTDNMGRVLLGELLCLDWRLLVHLCLGKLLSWALLEAVSS